MGGIKQSDQCHPSTCIPVWLCKLIKWDSYDWCVSFWGYTIWNSFFGNKLITWKTCRIIAEPSTSHVRCGSPSFILMGFYPATSACLWGWLKTSLTTVSGVEINEHEESIEWAGVKYLKLLVHDYIYQVLTSFQHWFSVITCKHIFYDSFHSTGYLIIVSNRRSFFTAEISSVWRHNATDRMFILIGFIFLLFLSDARYSGPIS